MSNVGANALEFQRDGFVIVRNVFSAEEVTRLREATKRHADEAVALGRIFEQKTDEVVPVGDLLGRPGIDVVFDERLVSIARSLLGDREIIYFGDSGMMIGGALRGFHKDNTCRDDANHPDWKTPYTLIRMGIYLEDHAEHSGGLKVRRGSHLCADITTGEIVDVPTRPGDVVVWSLRTTHSGFAVRVKNLPFLHLQPRFETRLPKSFALDQACQRLALFITYGLDDHHLAAYIEKHANLQEYPENYLYKSWLHSSAAPALDEAARARGCRIIRPVPDYGAQFGSKERQPLGYIPTGPSKPDLYPPRGMEAVIQTVGRVTRSLTGRSAV